MPILPFYGYLCRMKKSVSLSTWSFLLTCIVMGVFAGVSTWAWKNGMKAGGWILGGLLIIMLLAGLFYMPMSLKLTGNGLNINRALRIKTLPLAEIESVRLCAPTMGAKRICGSGGFMGYWGWFSERDLGKYFAYYGKSSDCFLVRMKDGRQYMLGCKDAPEMVAAIQSKLKGE